MAKCIVNGLFEINPITLNEIIRNRCIIFELQKGHGFAVGRLKCSEDSDQDNVVHGT